MHIAHTCVHCRRDAQLFCWPVPHASSLVYVCVDTAIAFHIVVKESVLLLHRCAHRAGRQKSTRAGTAERTALVVLGPNNNKQQSKSSKSSKSSQVRGRSSLRWAGGSGSSSSCIRRSGRHACCVQRRPDHTAYCFHSFSLGSGVILQG